MYSPSKFKYGNKTTSQINNLTGRTIGDTVYDTNRDKRDFYDGEINLNQDMIKLTATTTINEGYGVKLSATTVNKVQLSTASNTVVGVAAATATTNNAIAIVIGGVYPMRINGGSTRARYLLPNASGEFTDSSSAAVTVSGIILVANAASGNFNSLVSPCEKA